MEEVTGENMVGDFRVLASIRAGSGSQGTVYKAVCERDGSAICPRGTVVALKAMSVSGLDSDSAYEKLCRRTKALKSIECANVVKYLGCFQAQYEFAERHFIVQEFLDGETLADRLSSTRAGLDADEAIRITRGMVSGLAAAGEKGIVHRDIKPANVFLCSNGDVKLIDFEISRENASDTVSSGAMVGSYDYMAPDFVDTGFLGDEKSDIFSAGVVMHEALTGELPYKRLGRDSAKGSFGFLERWTRDGNGNFKKDACKISPNIERIIAHCKSVLVKALALKREERFGDFEEFLAALSGVRMRELRNGAHRYRILKLIGKGGFGEVFKVRSEGRIFAVKHLLKLQYASRFFREAKIMSELKDPSFVQFFDFFILEHAGEKDAFLVMDFLPGMPGSSLRDAIRASAGTGLDFETVIRAFIRYAHGLQSIHEKGVYHRDIKPTNLYFPPSDPDKAAIMDLGIAREENGTETSGQVPGTLDYMPPETALGETRGDAGMDVYALGLCLYEALTGKKAYPKLPQGNAALAQFFKRAQERVRPDFSDERVSSRPALLDLLVSMTNPDPAMRLSNAGEVGMRLRELIGLEPAGTMGDVPETTVQRELTNATASYSASDAADEEEETLETAFINEQDAQKAIKEEKSRKKVRKPKAKKSKSKVEHGKAPLVIASIAIVTFVVSGSIFFFRENIDGWFDSLSRYIRPPVSQAVNVPLQMVESVDEIETPVVKKTGPTQEEEEISEREKPVDTYNSFVGSAMVSSSATAAVAQTKAVQQETATASDADSKKEQAARRLIIECRNLVEMTTPVDSRMNRLAQAEACLKTAAGFGVIPNGEISELDQMIRDRRKWIVFEISNRTGMELEIGEKRLSNGESFVFVYTNAPPKDLAAAHKGYEPFPLGRQTNGKKLTLTPDYFELLKVAVETGPIPSNVVCRVDGVPILQGTIHLMPGTHECVYSRKGFRDITKPFEVEISTPTRLPPPGRWVRNEEGIRRSKGAISKLIGAEMAADGGDWDRANTLLRALPEFDDEEVETRKAALALRIKKEFDFLARADEAAQAFMDGNWTKTVSIYAALAKDGYEGSIEDRRRTRTAAENAAYSIETRLKTAQRGGRNEDVDALQKELSSLNAALGILKSKSWLK